MQIDGWTLALQAVNFLILIWLLRRFLYKPVKEIIEKRKALAEQAFVESARAKEDAEAARKRFEDGRAHLTQERQEMLKKVDEELERERGDVMDEARRQADRLLESARAAVAEERQAAIAEIRAQATELAVDLASTLLSKSGSGTLNDIFLDRIEKHLRDLSESERERLKNDSAVDGAQLTVVTATPLAVTDQDRWRRRLGACLSQAERAEFATDPDIIGGAELRFPHSVIKFTWADQLEKAKDIMSRDETAS